jgi:hypothetical protein
MVFGQIDTPENLERQALLACKATVENVIGSMLHMLLAPFFFIAPACSRSTTAT